MKNFDGNKLKFGISQKYGIPESEIDESVLTLYVMIDSMHDEIKDYQGKRFKQINYENPKSAFWGNFGSKGIVAIATSTAAIVLGLLFNSWYQSRELVKNLEVLKTHVQVREDGYYIDRKSYTLVKGGILITP